jgi:hypothetical protein
MTSPTPVSAPVWERATGPLLTRVQMAAVLGISPETLLRWEGERRIPFCRLSQKVTLYVLADVVAFVRTMSVPPVGAMTDAVSVSGQGLRRGASPPQVPNRRAL